MPLAIIIIAKVRVISFLCKAQVGEVALPADYGRPPARVESGRWGDESQTVVHGLSVPDSEYDDGQRLLL